MSRKIGVCLAGGGGAGVFQAGMLIAIDEMFGEEVVAVSGASVGTLNGALYCQNELDKCVELWKTIKKKDVFTWKIQLFKFGSESYGNPKLLYSLIDKYVNVNKLRGGNKEFYVQATNNNTFMSKIFTRKDDISLALKASTAIPILFPEVKIDGEFYVDGGVVDNTPTDPLIALGCDHIIMLHAHPKEFIYHREKILSRRLAIIRAINAVYNSGQRKDLERIKRINKAISEGRSRLGQRYVHLHNIYPVTSVNTLDFEPKKAEQRISEGYKITKKILSHLQK